MKGFDKVAKRHRSVSLVGLIDFIKIDGWYLNEEIYEIARETKGR
jgi:hypothetical protein